MQCIATKSTKDNNRKYTKLTTPVLKMTVTIEIQYAKIHLSMSNLCCMQPYFV
jgi:hypothetical protein